MRKKNIEKAMDFGDELSTLEDPSIQALLLLYECLSKGAETTLYHGWWMLAEDTKYHSSNMKPSPTKNGEKQKTHRFESLT